MEKTIRQHPANIYAEFNFVFLEIQGSYCIYTNLSFSSFKLILVHYFTVIYPVKMHYLIYFNSIKLQYLQAFYYLHVSLIYLFSLIGIYYFFFF